MPSRVQLSLKAYNGETSKVTVWGDTITVVNFAAMNNMIETLLAAIEAVSLGLPQHEDRSYEWNFLSSQPSADQDANRADKWLVRCHDETTFEIVTFSIPMADDSLLDPDNRNRMLVSEVPGSTLVTAIETYCVNPETGNALTVDEIIRVGRNL